MYSNTTLIGSKTELYEQLIPQVEALIDKQCGEIANYANVSAALQACFKFWWCGFYLVNSRNQLELGPFQGPPACTLIEFNKGVCGTAWAKAETILVEDVEKSKGILHALQKAVQK